MVNTRLDSKYILEALRSDKVDIEGLEYVGSNKKIRVSLKDIDRMKSEIGALFAQRQETLYVLFIKEYTGYLNRKGIEIDLEIEEYEAYLHE